MIAIYMSGHAVGRTTESVLRELATELEALRARTGKLVDAYSTTSVESAHATIVLQAAKAGRAQRSKDAEIFLGLLEEAVRTGGTLRLEGE
mgnify:CR=1 FL=1